MSDDSPWPALAVVGLIAFTAYQCSRSDSANETAGYSGPFFNEDEARDRAAEAAAESADGSTYLDQGAPYGCTEDCSGHEAGYEWASENGVTDPADCGGDSQSFIEGCETYAEAYQEAQEEALADEGLEPE